MLGVLACVMETILEIVVMLVVLGVPFVVIGIVCEAIRRAVEYRKEHTYKGYYYESGTRRSKWHKRIYDFFRDRGYDVNVAYNLASKITRWK